MKHCLRLFALTAVALGFLCSQARAADVFVATTAADFGTGSTAMLRAGTAEAAVNLLNIHSDAAVRYHNGMIYVINRTGQDNILLLDPAAPATPVGQYSLGNGTNPQDIEIIGPEKAYVTLLERDYMLIINPADGTELGRIDLSGLADSDGLPEAADMVRVGDRVFVCIQRLDRQSSWVPAGESYLAVIDVETDALVDVDAATDGVQSLQLASTNPGDIRALDTRVYVQQVGDYMALDGGIEVIDAVALTSEGMVITEQQLGGQCAGLAMASPTRGFTTSSTWPTYSVMPFDPEAGTVGAALEGHSGGYTPSMAVDGNRLIVADRGTEDNLDAAGLLIYDAATGELLAGPIDTGLPPNSLVVLSDEPVVTAVTGAAAAVPEQAMLGSAYPNPFNAGTQIPFVIRNADTEITLSIHDMLGRRVRTLVRGALPAGQRRIAWDGRDDAGRIAGNGVYVVWLCTGSAAHSAKVTLLK